MNYKEITLIVELLITAAFFIFVIFATVKSIRINKKSFYDSFKIIKFNGVEYYYRIGNGIEQTNVFSIPNYSVGDIKVKRKDISVEKLRELISQKQKRDSCLLYSIPINIEDEKYSKEKVLEFFNSADIKYRAEQSRLQEIKNGEII